MYLIIHYLFIIWVIFCPPQIYIYIKLCLVILARCAFYSQLCVTIETVKWQSPSREPMGGHSMVSGYSQSAHASWAKGGVIPFRSSYGNLAALEDSKCWVEKQHDF